jgi:hypothetical protein
MVHFKVMGKEYKLPIVSHVRIRTNNINVDRRPVVELDVTFRNRKFKNVRFSLISRRLNKYPILIGNKFMKLSKISVNVNARNTMSENHNQYVMKINSLQSLIEISEMHEILIEKLKNCRNDAQIQKIQEAINHIDVAKYNLKNLQQNEYNKEAIMHIDKKFAQFIRSIDTNNLNEQPLQLISEKRNRDVPGQMKFNFQPDPKNPPKPKPKKTKKKLTFKKFVEIITNWVDDNKDSLSQKAIQLASYKSARPGERRESPDGVPLGTGLQADKVDGNFLGRMWRKYKDNPTGPVAITIGVLKKMSSGDTSYMNKMNTGRGPGKWKQPHISNLVLKRRAIVHARRSQGRLPFAGEKHRQTQEFRGRRPSRMTQYGRVPISKMVRDRNTKQVRPSKSHARSLVRIKNSMNMVFIIKTN